MTPVKYIASKPPITASPDITIKEAAEIMVEKKIGFLVLVDGEEIYGVVSERDIIESVAAGISPMEKVSVIAKRMVIKIDADATIKEAASLMRKYGIRHLVVTQKGRLYGVLSIRDLVREREIFKSISEFPQPELFTAPAD
ncbi:MAG: CBS domain-containing protein [Pyrobaculum sp.]